MIPRKNIFRPNDVLARPGVLRFKKMAAPFKTCPRNAEYCHLIQKRYSALLLLIKVCVLSFVLSRKSRDWCTFSRQTPSGGRWLRRNPETVKYSSLTPQRVA